MDAATCATCSSLWVRAFLAKGTNRSGGQISIRRAIASVPRLFSAAILLSIQAPALSRVRYTSIHLANPLTPHDPADPADPADHSTIRLLASKIVQFVYPRANFARKDPTGGPIPDNLRALRSFESPVSRARPQLTPPEYQERNSVVNSHDET
jgi:hypothetical protein